MHFDNVIGVVPRCLRIHLAARRNLELTGSAALTQKAAFTSKKGVRFVTCTEFLDHLTDYFDGQIEPRLLADVKWHLARCRHCEVVLHTTRQTIEMYREREIFDFPPTLRERIGLALAEGYRDEKSNDTLRGGSSVRLTSRTHVTVKVVSTHSRGERTDKNC
jgi:hypothetical protein